MSKHWDPSWWVEQPIRYLTSRTSLPYTGPRICRAIVGPDNSQLARGAQLADLAQIQRDVGRFTWYLLCSRPRVVVELSEATVSDHEIAFGLSWVLDDGRPKHIEVSLCYPKPVSELLAGTDPERVVVVSRDGGPEEWDAVSLWTTLTTEPWAASDHDLEVHYIGRARGRVAEISAIDRLAHHHRYQDLLQRLHDSRFRNRTAWIVLCAGTTIHTVFAGENPVAADVKARRELSTDDRIDLVEALMINYFKPAMNKQHVGDLDLGTRPFDQARRAGFLEVEFAYGVPGLGVALYTEMRGAAEAHKMRVAL